jgi:predicted nuclease of restriction endonuclease-like RecB superfamily
MWDARVQGYRAPGHQYAALKERLIGSGARVDDRVCAVEAPAVESWEPVDLRPYQAAARSSWELAGAHGIVVLPTGSGNRLREPLPCHAPDGKAKLGAHVLERSCVVRRRTCHTAPTRARRVLFSEAQRARDRGAWERSRVLGEVAARFGLRSEELLESLFADLPGERILGMPSPVPDPHDLAQRTNLALAQGFLQRSSRSSISLTGNARAVVRQVRLRRLLCDVHPRTDPRRASIEISGPYSLFKRTLLYGRALASIVPLLRECDHFLVTADAVLRGRELRIRLQSGDPIFPASRLLRRYDSKLEERFARDFRKVAPDFDLVREPEPVRAGDRLLFPDFAIYQRRDPTRSVLVEIVGFWTPRYLEDKVRHLRLARLGNLLVCVDELLGCADGDLGIPERVIRYKRRIDAQEVDCCLRPGWKRHL